MTASCLDYKRHSSCTIGRLPAVHQLLVAAMGLRAVDVAVSQLDCAQGTQGYVYPQLQQLLLSCELEAQSRSGLSFVNFKIKLKVAVAQRAAALAAVLDTRVHVRVTHSCLLYPLESKASKAYRRVVMSQSRKSATAGVAAAAAAAAVVAPKEEPQEVRGDSAYLNQFSDIRAQELAKFAHLNTKDAVPQLKAAIKPYWHKALETVLKKKLIATKQPDGSTTREVSRYGTKVKRIDAEHSEKARQHIEQLLAKTGKDVEQERRDLTEALILLKQLDKYNMSPAKLHEQGCIPAWYQELTGISDCTSEFIDLSGIDDAEECVDVDEFECSTESSNEESNSTFRAVKTELVEHDNDDSSGNSGTAAAGCGNLMETSAQTVVRDAVLYQALAESATSSTASASSTSTSNQANAPASTDNQAAHNDAVMNTLSSTIVGSSTPQQHCDESQGASELKRKHDNAFLTDSASGISAAMSDSVSPTVTATEPATESNLQNSAATDTVVCGVETLAAASKKSKCHDGVHSDDNTSSSSAPVMSDVNADTVM
eukprot:15550-Heterococcus_DN1.PRE.1